MGNPALRLVTPTSEKQTVRARRQPNADYRTCEYLTEHEVEQLIGATKGNRQGHRDGTMILLAFRHGLRAAELCDLRWEQVEFETAVLHIRRRKNGTPSVHPLSGRELRALRRLRREMEASPFVFVSERAARSRSPPRTSTPLWPCGRCATRSAATGSRIDASSSASTSPAGRAVNAIGCLSSSETPRSARRIPASTRTSTSRRKPKPS